MPDQRDRRPPIPPPAAAVLAELEARREQENQPWIPRETGEVLYQLVVARKRPRILELGTAQGYSTIWLALGARATGGRVTTVDRDPQQTERARANLQRAGLLDLVELITGDAEETVRRLPGPFDLVFMDLWKDAYVPCLKALVPKLPRLGLIVADNAISHAEELQPYFALVRGTRGLRSETMAVGKGLEITLKLGEVTW